MNTTLNCADLCTKEKCDQLDNTISLLGGIVSNLVNTVDELIQKNIELTNKLESHINTRINDESDLAHEYIPKLFLDFSIDEQEFFYVLTIEFTLEGATAKRGIILDKDNDEFNLDAKIINKQLLISLYQNGLDTDIVTVDLPFVFQNDFDNHISTNVNSSNGHQYIPNVDVIGFLETSDNDQYLSIAVYVDDVNDKAIIKLPTSNNKINIDGSIAGKYLFLTVATETDTDTATIYLPIEEEVNNVFVNNFGDEILNCDLTPVLVAVDNCCNQLKTEIDNNQALIEGIDYKLDLRTGELETLSNQIIEALNFEFIGNALTNLACDFPTDDDGDIIPTYAASTYDTIPYSFSGFQGIHELLKAIINNQTIIQATACKAVSPPIKLNLDDFIDNLCAEEDIQSQDNFEELQQYFDYILDILLDRLDQSVTKLLLKRLGGFAGVAGFAVSTTLDWAIGHLIDKALESQNRGIKQICSKIKEPEAAEVVAITASDRDLARIQGKKLILHFVTFDNYPTRQANSSYRPIQIPSPIDGAELDWYEHFNDIIWIQGNLYSELFLKDSEGVLFKPSLSGFFQNEAAADQVFDKFLQLTTLEEATRVYHKRTSSSRDIPIRPTRVYRAFLTYVNNNGHAVCELRITPPKEE